ncbi:FkbM family methyltransferase [Falsiroseomonas sp. E2-1-a4]|uniref:FkbM family methyltransferase n=1 Tax=Falsiroseomonas sp. E2-1-a4 TaxID=3239299 RepID=UPI003F38C8C9
MPTIAETYARLRAGRKAGKPVDFEALLRKFYGGLLKPGDIALDIGCFKATHAVPMADAIRGPGAALHAFEANPAMAAALRPVLARPGREHVTLHECAVGAADGEATYVVAVDSPGYSGLQQREYDQPDMRTEHITVRTVKLDTLLGHLPALAFIKIDIEGGEFDALRGGVGLVERLRPAISFEFGVRSYGAYGVKPAEVFDWFATRRYMLFDIIGTPLPSRELFLEADRTPGLWDFLAVPEENVLARRQAWAQQLLID